MAGGIAGLRYQPFYCEENIWQLCQHPQYQGGQVIFIAAHGDCFPMLQQEGGLPPDYPVYWDYHVILLHAGSIQDFNSTLGFSTPLVDYFTQSFISEHLLVPAEIPWFRVLAADEYVHRFRSDRRHMRNDADWQAPPPEWPLISEGESNLQRFADMGDLEFGEVLSAVKLLSKFQSQAKRRSL